MGKLGGLREAIQACRATSTSGRPHSGRHQLPLGAYHSRVVLCLLLQNTHPCGRWLCGARSQFHSNPSSPCADYYVQYFALKPMALSYVYQADCFTQDHRSHPALFTVFKR